MISFSEYLLKTGISLTVFYLFYWLVMRKDTHFYLNRLVLLLSVVLSLVLPLIHTCIINAPPVLAVLPSFSLDFEDPGAFISPGVTTAAAANASPVNYWKIITLVYLVGGFIVLARLIYQAIFLHAVSRLSNKTNYNGYTIVSMNTDLNPFSYFKRIFIPSKRIDESAFDSIIAHEKSHLKQWHYIDLLIVEIITVLQWFNPVVWLFERSIKEIHEYLADETVLNSGNNQGKYQALLVNQAIGGPVFILTNQFNQSLTKKRIMMMKRTKTSKMAKLKALFILPLIAGLLLAFTNQQTKSLPEIGGHVVTVAGNVSDRSTGDALPGGLVLIKGTTVGTITDKDGNYSINVSNNAPVLVYSLVGFRTQEIPVGGNSIINVQLEQDILEIDYSQENKLNANTDQKDTEGQKSNQSELKEDMYVINEELPCFPGGTEALQQYLKVNLRYPIDAKSMGIEGKVMVNFVVNAEGIVSNAKIMRGVSPELDAEALRLVNSMNRWKPASHNGVPLSMAVTMPIEFKIN